MNIPDNLKKYLADKPEDKISGRLGNERIKSSGIVRAGLLPEYRKFIDDNYESNPILYVSASEDAINTGGNIFAAVAVNDFLNKKHGTKVATMAEIGNMLESDEHDDLKKYDILAGLAVVDYNSFYDYRMGKIKESVPDYKFPCKLDIRDLKLEINTNAPEGLDLVADGKNACRISHLVYATNYDKTDQWGLPVPKHDGKKTWFEIRHGLNTITIYRGTHIGASRELTGGDPFDAVYPKKTILIETDM